MPLRIILIITFLLTCTACSNKTSSANTNVAYLSQEETASSVAIYKDALSCSNPKALTPFFGTRNRSIIIPAEKLITLRIINHNAENSGFLYISFIPQKEGQYVISKVPNHHYLSLWKMENSNSKKPQRTTVRFLVRKINFWGRCNDTELQEKLQLLMK